MKGNATFQIEVDENKDLKLFFTKKNPVKEVEMVKKKKKTEPLYDQLHNYHFIGEKNHSFRQHVFQDLDVCFKILYLKKMSPIHVIT